MKSVHMGMVTFRFTNREIQYEEGDQIYLFTDGYADQFGGPEGKKFMYKPFMNLLLNNAGESMEKQNENLSETFDTWKGTLPQVDDITVIGLNCKFNFYLINKFINIITAFLKRFPNWKIIFQMHH
jgi:serine phosphatase RsbU (regulator of sigma subunit)